MKKALNLMPEGYIDSIRKDQDDWAEIYSAFQRKTPIQAEVKSVVKHTINSGRNIVVPCLRVQIGTIIGIVPIDETGIKNIPSAEEYMLFSTTEKQAVIRRMERQIGLPVWVIITAVDRENEIFVASRKIALEHISEKTWEKIQEGDIVLAAVREIFPANAIVDIGGVSVLLPAREIRHGWVDDLRDELKPGEIRQAKIIKIDRENRKVEVSFKALLPSPWPDCLKRYEKGGLYAGIVSGVRENSVFVDLEPGLTATAHHPKFSVKKGDRVRAYVYKIDPDAERIYVRLRK